MAKNYKQRFDKPPLEKQKQEAKEKDMELISRTEKGCYGYYRMACGHFSVLHYGAVRKAKTNDFKCSECINEKYKQDATSVGLEIVPQDNYKKDTRLYKFMCGHIAELKASNIAHGKYPYTCQQCIDLELTTKIKEQGMELVSKGKKNKNLYRLSCGHTKVMSRASVVSTLWRCKECYELKLHSDAEKRGIRYLPEFGRSTHEKRTYQLSCGCIKEIDKGCVVKGAFECKNHPDRFIDFSGEISVYLSRFDFSMAPSVLKLGFAMDVEGRAQRYGLNGSCTVLHKRTFSNGEQAVKLERNLHLLLKPFVIDKEEMRKYMENGFTECYPIEMLDEITTMIKESND